MRTTLELADNLARRAKLAAVNRGVSLKALVATALEHELTGKRGSGAVPLHELPVVKSDVPGTYELTPDRLSEILVREEAAAYEATQRR